MDANWANFLLALIVAIASTLAFIAGWFFFFFRGWFEQWIKKLIQKELEDFIADNNKFKKKSINAINKILAEQTEVDKTLLRLAKDFWKTKMHAAQIMDWASKIHKERIYSFVPSKRAIESFDDYWEEIKLDLDKLEDPFASQSEK